jgi:CRP-like cAMP-binding protein
MPAMARAEPAELLRSVPLFSACSKRDLVTVWRRAQPRSAEPGTVLVREGAAGSEFFVILDGRCTVSRRGRAVATLETGGFFGDLALLDRAPRNATVTAATPVQMLVLGQRDFDALLAELPGFARKLLAGLARRLREADARDTQ